MISDTDKPLERPLGGVYVQFGCGAWCPEGWISFDTSPTLRLQRLPFVGSLFKRGKVVFPKAARVGDIVKGLPMAASSVDGMYASHVLEHLSLAGFRAALLNTYRVLKPGGIFRLIVPDLEARSRRYLEMLAAKNEAANSWFMRATHLGIESREQGIEALARTILGNSSHLWMWDETSMRAALTEAGFVHVRRCSFGDCRDPAFRLVEDRNKFFDEFAGCAECAMEAIKPTGQAAQSSAA